MKNKTTRKIRWKNLLYCGMIWMITAGFQVNVIAQASMETGYELLNTARYAEARSFFEGILRSEPQNKTAKICLGRALGLGGNPEEALNIFEDLTTQYQGDLEVLYNIAEAHLWNLDPQSANKAYEAILAINESDSKGLLGKANALSAMEDYEQAVAYIDQTYNADPENGQVRLSRKFIYLARADQLRRMGDINAAHAFVDEALILYPLDEQGLFDKATTYLFEQKYRDARSIFRQLQRISDQKVRLMSGLSYTSLLLNDKKGFLNYADSAVYYQKQMPDPDIDVYLNRARALTINNRSKEALSLIDSLQTIFPDDKSLPLTTAQLTLWMGKKNKALERYKLLYDSDSTSIQVITGLAETLKAVGRHNEALFLAKKAAALQPDNPDIQRMAKSYEMATGTILDGSFRTSSDKGNNEAVEWTLIAKRNVIQNLALALNVNQRIVQNPILGERLRRERYGIDAYLQIDGALALSTSAGLDRIEQSEGTYTKNISGNLGLSLTPGKVHSIRVDYTSVFLDYNPSLLSEKIRINDWKLTYHLFSPSNVGLYNQFIYTDQSDNNRRWLYFGSLYYNLHSYPVMQVALNYNVFQFNENRPQSYFSPDMFQSVEVMGKLDSAPIQGSQWRYLVTAATGFQFIEENQAQWTLRVEGSLSYVIHERISAGINYLYSNAASSTAAGFTFQQFGIQLKAIL